MSDKTDPKIKAMIDEFVSDPTVTLPSLVKRCSTREEEKALLHDLKAALALQEYFDSRRRSFPTVELDPRAILQAAVEEELKGRDDELEWAMGF